MSETINFPEDFDSSIEYEYDASYDCTASKVNATASGLAEFASWCVDHPEFVVEFLAPTYKDHGSLAMIVNISTHFYPSGYEDPETGRRVYPPSRNRTPAEMAAEMLRVRRLAGLTQKFATSYNVGFYKDFGPISGVVRLTVQMPRQVTCDMVPTGETEIVEERQVVHPAVIETVAVERPVMKRVCADSLGALAAAEGAEAAA